MAIKEAQFILHSDYSKNKKVCLYDNIRTHTSKVDARFIIFQVVVGDKLLGLRRHEVVHPQIHIQLRREVFRLNVLV